MFEYAIPSSFEDHPIKVREIIAPDSNKVVVYVHGSFDHMDGHFGFYTELFKEMATSNQASFVQLTTARKPCYDDGTQEGVLGAFEGKDVLQESDDVARVIQRTIERMPSFIGGDAEPEIILIGLSLGGTMAALNAYKSPLIKKIMLISSGSQTRNKGLPMMATYPNREFVEGEVAKFQGEVLHITPEADQVVPVEFQEQLYGVFRGLKNRIRVPFCDHVLTYFKPNLKEWIKGFVAG